MQPLDLITVGDRASYSCCVPFCYGWPKHTLGERKLCDFHADFYRRQLGEPWYAPEDVTPGERADLYRAHVNRAMTHIPYHLLQATLWPGPNAEERRKQAKREKSLKEKWNEEHDSD